MTLKYGRFTLLSVFLGILKALGAPLPMWVVVLPVIVDLILVALLVLFLGSVFLFFWLAERGGYRPVLTETKPKKYRLSIRPQ